MPASIAWPVLAFFLLWLGTLGFGIWTVVSAGDFPPQGRDVPWTGDLFVLAVLAFLAVATFRIVRLCLWMLGGREILRWTRREVSLRREIFGFGRARRYDAREISSLRVLPGFDRPFGFLAPRSPWGKALQSLAIDCSDGQTVCFGSGIDTAEAARLVERLQPLLPSTETRTRP